MTDQNLTADVTPEDMAHARAYMQDVLDATYIPDRIRAVARVLQALLPAPTLPTMAGMTPEERAECQWMQADVKGYEHPAVIITANWVIDHAELLDRWGKTFSAAYESITPRPDLPRMTFPGDQKPAPSLPDGWRLADHPDRGRVIVTTENPDRHGYVAFTYRANYLNSGRGNDWCKHDELTYIDQETATPEAVPPNTLTEGSEWDSVDALARACDESGRDQIVVADKDGEVFVWGADAEWWETGLPGCDYAPHKILHTGRKADW